MVKYLKMIDNTETWSLHEEDATLHQEDDTVNKEINRVDLNVIKVWSLKQTGAKMKQNNGNNNGLSETPFSCTFSFCDCKFKLPNSLEYHLQCHCTDRETFSCPECSQIFKTWNLAQIHLSEQHEIDVDLEIYSNKSEISESFDKMTKKHAERLCSFCGYITKNKRSYEEHIRLHTGEKPYKCQFCDYCTGRKYLLTTHLMVHSGEKKYKCPHCPYASISSANYKNHIKARHPGQDGVYLCQKCSYCSINQKRFQLHLMKSHNSELNVTKQHTKAEKINKQTKFNCHLCNYQANYNYLLKEHIRRHKGEKPYKCEFCKYGSSSKKSLKLHRMKHTGEMRYKCPHCSYTVISTSSYKNHLKLKHPGMNDCFTCSICSHSTTVYSSFIKHVCEENLDFMKPKAAETDKPHQGISKKTENDDSPKELCPLCGCSINDPNHYKKHIQQEKDKKKYMCNLCAYSTDKKSRLKVHKMAHDGEKLCKCAYCPFITVYIETFRRHLKRKHPDLKAVFICAMCAYRSINHHKFLKHINIHKRRYRIGTSSGIVPKADTSNIISKASKSLSVKTAQNDVYLNLEVWEDSDIKAEEVENVGANNLINQKNVDFNSNENDQSQNIFRKSNTFQEDSTQKSKESNDSSNCKDKTSDNYEEKVNLQLFKENRNHARDSGKRTVDKKSEMSESKHQVEDKWENVFQFIVVKQEKE